MANWRDAASRAFQCRKPSVSSIRHRRTVERPGGFPPLQALAALCDLASASAGGLRAGCPDRVALACHISITRRLRTPPASTFPTNHSGKWSQSVQSQPAAPGRPPADPRRNPSHHFNPAGHAGMGGAAPRTAPQCHKPSSPTAAAHGGATANTTRTSSSTGSLSWRAHRPPLPVSRRGPRSRPGAAGRGCGRRGSCPDRWRAGSGC
jgi:hypothetical protein